MSERIFKRMVLGLPQSSRDYAAVAAAAELAELLGIALAATFVEDATLLGVAELPYVRELRSLGGGWQQISLEQLEHDIARSAAAARRLFDEVTQLCNIETSFSLVRGSAANVLPSQATAEDILVIVEPRNPSERVTQQFTELLAAAFSAVAAVMIVPSRIARARGPIVAVAADPDDPSIAKAIGIAAAARERLIMVPVKNFGSSSMFAERVAAAGVKLEITPAVRMTPNASTLAACMAGLKGRIIVMQRGIFEDAIPVRLASLCAIPVLVIEPNTSSGLTQKVRRSRAFLKT